MEHFLGIIFPLAVLLFSVVAHELAHGLMALRLGDPTAKYAGRLTLNPLAHLDLVGSFLVPLLMIVAFGFGFGWAKPVPINPYNFRDQRWGSLKVALAGPGSNILIALFFALFIRFALVPAVFFEIFSLIILINLLLAFFNLVPIPPLDGSHILFSFLPYQYEHIKLWLQQFGFLLLLILIFSGGFKIVFVAVQAVYLFLIR